MISLSWFYYSWNNESNIIQVHSIIIPYLMLYSLSNKTNLKDFFKKYYLYTEQLYKYTKNSALLVNTNKHFCDLEAKINQSWEIIEIDMLNAIKISKFICNMG